MEDFDFVFKIGEWIFIITIIRGEGETVSHTFLTGDLNLVSFDLQT